MEGEKKDLEAKETDAELHSTHAGATRDEIAETLKVDAWGFDIVKAIVSAEDDPTEPVFTFRFWFLGTILGIFAGSLGQLYTFKPQTVAVSSLMLSVFGYVGGLFLSKVLPTGILNPSKFNKKELALTVICASTAGKGVASTLIIGAKDLFFNQKYAYVDAIILVMVTQFIGYGAVGLFRPVLVYPRRAFYPTALSGVSLYETLFAQNLNDKAFKLFWMATAGLFFWTFMPQYLAPTLIGVSVFCLANQNSPRFTQLFGGVNNNEGLGILSISFDWNNIGEDGLVYPWVTQVNQMVGMIGCVIIIPLLYDNNVWNAKSFPFMAQGLYLATGKKYNQSKILTNNALDEDKYAAYGQPYYASSWAFNTMMQNMSVTAGIVHVILWHGSDIMAGARSVINKKKNAEGAPVGSTELTDVDETYLLTSVHPEVPHWWYGLLMVISLALGFYSCLRDDSLPWWAFILTIVMAFFFIIVSGLLAAFTGFSPPFKTFIQLIGGFILPGKPIANMYFTTFGANTITEAVAMCTDLKVGQYMKIAPRAVFWAQMYGGFIGALVHWVLNHIVLEQKRDILLDPNGDNNWSGQNIIGFNTKAITFGTLAPKILAAGGTYEWLSYAFIVGALLPIPFWLGHKYFPKVGFNYVNTAILSWYFCIFTVGVNSGWTSRIILGFTFQLYMRRYQSAWFNKYTYILAAGLNAGTQLAVFLMSFAFQGAGGVTVDPPFWALNPNPESGVFSDYCTRSK
ncbi:OPT oligopeptide transporter protein-domain-containing protein [Chytriomyces cf. hyalinus JEL632]|nr:OPT oligopeptide transporter protein-domain-containing protein [Chytriomyces cf. hyalinus JEL632]